MDERSARHLVPANCSVLDECLTLARSISIDWTGDLANLSSGGKVFVSTCPASATFLRGHLGDFSSSQFANSRISVYRSAESMEGVDVEGVEQQTLLANVYDKIPGFGTLVECFDMPTDACAAFAESLLSHLAPNTVILMDVTKPGSFNTIVPNDGQLRYLATSSSTPLQWCQWLELPNLLDSCSAALISACEISRIECYLFASPLESLYGQASVSLSTLAQYLPILKHFAPDSLRSVDTVHYPLPRLHASSSIYV